MGSGGALLCRIRDAADGNMGAQAQWDSQFHSADSHFTELGKREVVSSDRRKGALCDWLLCHVTAESGSYRRGAAGTGEASAMWFPLVLLPLAVRLADAVDNEWVHLPNKCEVCKYVAVELKSSFEETSRRSEVIDTHYGFLDGAKKQNKIKYKNSDIRFIEVTEGLCQRLLEYNLHKERSGSNRFAKGMSETFQTLHHLVHKGVKVVMDIPYELWNETSAEVADMKKQCDVMMEEFEDVIEDWYRHHQQEDLTDFLCAQHVLKGQDKSCLSEMWSSKKGDPGPSSGKKKTKKGEKKKSKKAAKDSNGKRNNGAIPEKMEALETQIPQSRSSDEL